jgi:serine/threonine protein kinase
MELVEGRDVHDILQSTRVPLGPALEILSEVAGALHIAWHTLGPDGQPLKLLHRDIKPHNIMLTPAGDVKVMDFGIARANFGSREAMTQRVLFGSPGYMAPERLEGEELAAGDVYSLGVLLFEMLTGQMYGKTTVNPRKFNDRLTEAAQALDALDPRPPAEVYDLIRSMMAYEHEERPTAREVERRARDLRVQLGGPWLRDWAEEVLGELPAPSLQPHDFSRDVVTESRTSPGWNFEDGSGAAASRATPAPAPSAAAELPRRPTLSTFNPDDPFIQEAAQAVLAPPAAPELPAPPPATPAKASATPAPVRRDAPAAKATPAPIQRRPPPTSQVGNLAIGSILLVTLGTLLVGGTGVACTMICCGAGGN